MNWIASPSKLLISFASASGSFLISIKSLPRMSGLMNSMSCSLFGYEKFNFFFTKLK